MLKAKRRLPQVIERGDPWVCIEGKSTARSQTYKGIALEYAGVSPL